MECLIHSWENTEEYIGWTVHWKSGRDFDQMLGTIRKLRIEAEAVSFKNRRLEHNMVLNDLTLCNNVLYLRGVPEDESIEDADRD
ncbi:hypothetical protein NC653_040427 [Populus alba x Populus x berolinensis]|uniref:Uncharacterized protein n=1 Tax=Populus alba x Populus x berolinensis TaxID=444605 RepID=A0AAD6LDP3_9ROSI|nr:hypothetical protein NC653_040427 [Populus alba x Populus x berolinensis]